METRHMNPNSFQKMSVKLATQLLSHRVYAAIKIALRIGELVSSTGENSAYCVKTMDDLFDALNSIKLRTKKHAIVFYAIKTLKFQTQLMLDMNF